MPSPDFTMEKTLPPETVAAKKRTAKKAVAQQVAREQVGMLRWLRLTARKTASSPKAVVKSGNPAADAAAEALTAMLKDAKNIG